MTTQQIGLVQRSFEKLKPIAGQTGIMFYNRLFSVDPSLRGYKGRALIRLGISARQRPDLP